MPDAPVAAPAAAAPAASSAPAVSTPAAAPAAAVETPVAAPADGGAGVPAEGGAAAPLAAAAPAEPTQDQYEGDVQAFLEAHSAWERKRDGIEDPAPAEVQPAEEKPAEAVEFDKPAAGEPEPKAASITPEALNSLVKKSPELQAAMDANPEVKSALFGMARTIAKLEPIGKIFPNVESAEYAADASNRFTSHRINFLDAADSPEKFPDAYAAFADEFVERGADGKPMVDQAGNPVYGQDFQMLNDYIVNTYHDVEIGDLEQAIGANKFATDEERESADMALQAFKFIKEWKEGNSKGAAKPDLSKLDPDTRAFYERKEAELAEREAALTGKEKTQTSAEKQAAKAKFETEIVSEMGSTVGKRLAAMIAEKEKVGSFIPSYALKVKDPETGISVFAKNLLDQLEEATYGRTDRATGKVIGGVAFIRNQAKMLARRPPSPEARQARLDFAMRLIDEHLPQIFDRNFREAQNDERADRSRSQGNVDARQRLTTPEPRAGSAPTPKTSDPANAMKEAYTWVDQQFPDLTPAERTEKALIRKNSLTGARY